MGVQTQMGTQLHAGENFRRLVELIQSVAMREVREAHIWVSQAWGWRSLADDTPNEVHPIPQFLDWDSTEMKIPHAPKAEKYLGRTYSKGWQLL